MVRRKSNDQTLTFTAVLHSICLLIFLSTGIISVCNVSAQSISGIVNNYTRVVSFSTCAPILSVESTKGFTEGEKVFLIQMKGALADTSNIQTFGTLTSLGSAGLCEINTIDSIRNNNIYLRFSLVNTYSVSGIVQLVSIKQSSTKLTIRDTVKAQAWDGFTGGIIVLNAPIIELNAPISANSVGFRGGSVSLNRSDCGFMGLSVPYASGLSAGRGETYVNILPELNAGRGSIANAGGGGNAHNAGGGGGANGGSGGLGGNEFTGCGTKASNGGWGGNEAIYSNDVKRIYLGGGGGGGHQNNSVATRGGNGGGIIILITDTLFTNGYSINAIGESAPNTTGIDATGGGGAGGVIYVSAKNIIGSLNLNVKGGDGGIISSSACHGAGGGGGGGVVLFRESSFLNQPITELSGGKSGLNLNSSNPCNNTGNGALAGRNGKSIYNFSIPESDEKIEPLKVEFNNSYKACAGSSMRLFVNTSGGFSPYTYKWTPEIGLSNSNAPSNTITVKYGAIQYVCTVTDSKGCSIQVSSVVESYPIIDLYAMQDTSICKNTAIQMNPKYGASGGGSVGYTFSWTPTTGLSSPSIERPYVAPLKTTTYTLYVTNRFGCVDSSSVTINVKNNISADAGESIKYVCKGGRIRLGNPSSVTQSAKYSWSPVIGLDNPNSATPTLTADQTRMYILTVDDNSGCLSYDTVTVFIQPLPMPVFATDEPKCDGETQFYGIVGDSLNPQTYIWNTYTKTGTARGEILRGQQTNRVDVQWTGDGTAGLQLRIDYTNTGCTVQGEHNVTVVPKPKPEIVPLTPTRVCVGENVSLDAGDGYTAYQWSNGAQTRIITTNSVGSYSVSVRNKNNCLNVSAPVAIENIQVEAPLISGIDKLCTNTSTTLKAQDGFKEYRWSDGSITQTIQVTTPGKYSVQGLTEQGCWSSATTHTIQPVSTTLLLQPEVVFEEQETSTNAIQTFSVSNSDNDSLIITEIDVDDQSDVFEITGLSKQLPATLSKGEKLLVSVSFHPKKRGEYSSFVKLKASSPCEFQTQTIIKGTAFYPDLAIHTEVGSVYGVSVDKEISIPVYAKILDPLDEVIPNSSLEVMIEWNARLFEPLSVTKGKISASNVENNQRLLVLNIDDVLLDSSKREVTQIKGLTLASTLFYTPLTIRRHHWDNLPRVPKLTASSGELSMDRYCFPRDVILFGDRPTSLQIAPNPVFSHPLIKVNTTFPGEYTIDVFSQTGQLLASKKMFVGNPQEVTIEFSEQSWQSGVYAVELRAPNITERTLMTVLK
jgi:hypothetical protein